MYSLHATREVTLDISSTSLPAGLSNVTVSTIRLTNNGRHKDIPDDSVVYGNCYRWTNSVCYLATTNPNAIILDESCRALTALNHGFLSGCSALTSLDLGPLSNVTRLVTPF